MQWEKKGSFIIIRTQKRATKRISNVGKVLNRGFKNISQYITEEILSRVQNKITLNMPPMILRTAVQWETMEFITS